MIPTPAQIFKFKLFFLVFSIFIGFAQPSLAAPRCEQLFAEPSVAAKELTLLTRVKLNIEQFMQRFRPQKISKKMVSALYGSVKTLLADTTGKRVESKVTADTQVVNDAIARFKEKLASKGIAIVDRDKKILGKRNVTYTEYTQPFSAKLRDLQEAGFEIRPEFQNRLDTEVTVKVRIRSYGTVDESKTEFGISDIEFAEFTKDRAFVELKFQDPSYEGAVFKPQAYMNKKYLSLLGTPEFLEHFDEIKNETLNNLKISSKKTLDQTSVESMLSFLHEAHIEKLNLSIVAINIYERVAKSARLVYNYKKDPQHDSRYGTEETVALEMTFDQLISLFVPGSENNIGESRYYKAYGPHQTVSEFKTPTRIAHHLKRALDQAKSEGKQGLVVSSSHAKELEQILPGLKEYFEMMNEIIVSRDEAKELNRGKWGIAIKRVRSQIEDLLNQFYQDDLQVAH